LGNTSREIYYANIIVSRNVRYFFLEKWMQKKIPSVLIDYIFAYLKYEYNIELINTYEKAQRVSCNLPFRYIYPKNINIGYKYKNSFYEISIVMSSSEQYMITTHGTYKNDIELLRSFDNLFFTEIKKSLDLWIQK